jgi:hypothetical protein
LDRFSRAPEVPTGVPDSELDVVGHSTPARGEIVTPRRSPSARPRVRPGAHPVQRRRARYAPHRWTWLVTPAWSLPRTLLCGCRIVTTLDTLAASRIRVGPQESSAESRMRATRGWERQGLTAGKPVHGCGPLRMAAHTREHPSPFVRKRAEHVSLRADSSRHLLDLSAGGDDVRRALRPASCSHTRPHHAAVAVGVGRDPGEQQWTVRVARQARPRALHRAGNYGGRAQRGNASCPIPGAAG